MEEEKKVARLKYSFLKTGRKAPSELRRRKVMVCDASECVLSAKEKGSGEESAWSSSCAGGERVSWNGHRSSCEEAGLKFWISRGELKK